MFLIVIFLIEKACILKEDESDFRDYHESVDNYLFGKMLFIASKTDKMGLRYPSTKMTIPAPPKKRLTNRFESAFCLPCIHQL